MMNLLCQKCAKRIWWYERTNEKFKDLNSLSKDFSQCYRITWSTENYRI